MIRKCFFLVILVNILSIPISAVEAAEAAAVDQMDGLAVGSGAVSDFSVSDLVSDVIPASDGSGDGSFDLLSESVAVMALDPITPADSNGLKAIILELLGDYEAVAWDYTYTSNNQYVSHSIDIQPDYPWLVSAAVFVVVLFCTFKLGGTLFSKL